MRPLWSAASDLLQGLFPPCNPFGLRYPAKLSAQEPADVEEEEEEEEMEEADECESGRG